MIKSYKLFLESKESEVSKICNQYNIKNWSLNEDGSIDVDNEVNLSGVGLTIIPLKFQNVSGNFWCSHNQLTSLEGAPQSVGGNFYCYSNQLTSLEGAPESVNDDFWCHVNQLTSLEGCPKSVGRNFYCYNNQLTSLEGAPQSVGGSFCCHLNQLTSLKGAPQSVGGVFYCQSNQLTSLEGAPRSIGIDFWCSANQLTSLEGCPENFIEMDIYNNPISEFTSLFKKLTPDLVRYLNEYDVIQDDIIVMDRLKAVVDTLGVKFNFGGLNHLKNYRIEK